VRFKCHRLFCRLPATTLMGLSVISSSDSSNSALPFSSPHNVCDARHGSNFFITENSRRELIHFSRSYRFLLKLGLCLVSAEEIVQSPVEEISNNIVEFLNAVEFEWNHFA
jgi:hypothetical protein